MKKLVKLSTLTGILLLYIFALSVENYTVINPAYLSNPNNNTSGYFTDQSAHLFSHTNQNLQLVYDFSGANFPEPCKLFRQYWSAVEIADNLFESKYIQHTDQDRSSPPKFSKPDIVYPFHYFL